MPFLKQMLENIRSYANFPNENMPKCAKFPNAAKMPNLLRTYNKK